jgi:hypothetical protein
MQLYGMAQIVPSLNLSSFHCLKSIEQQLADFLRFRKCQSSAENSIRPSACVQMIAQYVGHPFKVVRLQLGAQRAKIQQGIC